MLAVTSFDNAVMAPLKGILLATIPRVAWTRYSISTALEPFVSAKRQFGQLSKICYEGKIIPRISSAPFKSRFHLTRGNRSELDELYFFFSFNLFQFFQNSLRNKSASSPADQR